MVKGFHTWQQFHRNSMPFSRQPAFAPKLLSQVPARPRLGLNRGLPVRMDHNLALSGLLRGFRFICKRG